MASDAALTRRRCIHQCGNAGADLQEEVGRRLRPQEAVERPPRGVGLIGDTVFLDRDGDGGEPLPGEGIQGVAVNLYDSAGLSLLATTATDAEGHYDFGGLEVVTKIRSPRFMVNGVADSMR